VHRLIVLVQAAVKPASAIPGVARNRGCQAPKRLVSPPDLGEGSLGADAALEDSPEGPGEDLVIFDVGGVLFVGALWLHHPWFLAALPEVEAAADVGDFVSSGLIRSKEALPPPVEDPEGEEVGQGLIELFERIAVR
jgi:hypothetical protein